MIGDGKNPLAGESDREIRLGLFVVTVVYMVWMVMSFTEAGQSPVYVWVIRVVLSLFFIYSWYAGVREICRRKRGQRP